MTKGSLTANASTNMFKNAFTLFLTVLALQGIYGNQLDADPANSKLGLIEKFKKTITQLNNVIQNTIINAFIELDIQLNKVLDISENILQTVSTNVDNLLNKAFQELAELNAEAERLKINVTECLGENEEALKELNQKFLNKTNKCLDREDIIDGKKDEIGKSLYVINIIVEKFRQCSGILASFCMKRLISEANREIVNIPQGIWKEVNKTGKLMATVKTNLTLCGTRNIAEATVEILRLSNIINNCIKNKLQTGL